MSRQPLWVWYLAPTAIPGSLEVSFYQMSVRRSCKNLKFLKGLQEESTNMYSRVSARFLVEVCDASDPTARQSKHEFSGHPVWEGWLHFGVLAEWVSEWVRAREREREREREGTRKEEKGQLKLPLCLGPRVFPECTGRGPLKLLKLRILGVSCARPLCWNTFLARKQGEQEEILEDEMENTF